MPSRSRIPKELWEHYKAMSVDVGKERPFLQDTGCMNQDQRVMIALLNTAKRALNNEEFDLFIDQVVLPYVQELGWALWGRDVVTDLGFVLSGRRSQRKNISKILKFKLIEEK